MKLAYQTNTWGGVVGHPAGVTSVKDLFYLSPGSLESILPEIAGVGYQGFEVFDGNLQPFAEDSKPLLDLCRDLRLELVAVYSGANFIYPDILEDELWRVRTAADWAKTFGARYLVVGGGAIRASGTTDEDYRLLAQGLDQVIAIAEARGLEASFHPHLGTIAQSPEQVDRIFELSGIAFCPDTAHLVAGGADLVELVRKHAARINYVHLKDWGRGGQFLPLGDGDLDLEGVVDLLKGRGYDGWITVELDYSPTPVEAARKSLAYLRGQGL